MRVRRALAVPLLAVVAAGCSDVLDEATLEEKLTQQVRPSLAEPAMTVDCPSDAEVEAGATFTCTARAPDGAVTLVEVTQLDDAGHVEWRVVGAEAAADGDES
jgi:Domain of unknown function (DUF4333)